MLTLTMNHTCLAGQEEDYTPIPVLDSTEVADRVETMRLQEETTYKRVDYLKAHRPPAEENSSARRSRRRPLPTGPKSPIDEDCRAKMSEWCFQVVDFCQFSRETVEIGMNYLDRFLASSHPTAKKAMTDRKDYQLASMTTLYMAIKLFEPMEMDTSLLAELSRGCYTDVEIAQMEQDILAALQWRMNGPTTLSFVRHLLALLPVEVVADPVVASTVMDLAQFQTELATGEYRFTQRKQSTVALACVLNALDGVGSDMVLPHERQDFLHKVSALTDMDPNSKEVRKTREYLLRCFVHSLGSDIWEKAAALVETAELEEAEELYDTTITIATGEKRNENGGDEESSPICVSRT